ncbi:MAG: WYL domain-containing protein [Muribaculaceae bacterium]|nr:WYL domain-containing protein [Muribaculaceae bacterium]
MLQDTFALNRIGSLHVQAYRFSRKKDFDVVAKFKDSYGVYSSEEYPIEDIVLMFDTEDGNYLDSCPIHHSQHVINKKDGEVVIGLRLRIIPDFIMEFLSRSWSVKIVSPDSLRRRVCDILREALNRNDY